MRAREGLLMEMKKKRLGVVLQWISLIETLSVAVWNNMKQFNWVALGLQG
jgi:hypothetical protein